VPDPRPPYRRFAVFALEVKVGEVLETGEKGPSHSDLLEALAGPRWAERLEETACGWLLGERPPYEVCLAVYTSAGLEASAVEERLKSWSRERGTALRFT
jgi:hypothetical protein